MGHGVSGSGQMGHNFWMGHIGHGSQYVDGDPCPITICTLFRVKHFPQYFSDVRTCELFIYTKFFRSWVTYQIGRDSWVNCYDPLSALPLPLQ